MRHVPSPVTIVTAADGETRRGITIGSFASTSLEPPLISFNLARDAQMYPLMREVAHFAVHVLSDRQAKLANQFSLPDLAPEEQFAGVEHFLDSHGLPILSEAVSVITCRRTETYDAGDHIIVLGEVIAVDDEAERRPMVYYDRNYHEIGAAADTTLFDPVQESSRES